MADIIWHHPDVRPFDESPIVIAEPGEAEIPWQILRDLDDL